MGCDIHMKGVYKATYLKGAEVFEIPPYFTARDYSFFGVLAGVRDTDQVPVKQPCGVAAELQRTLDGAEHSFSTISLAELKKYHKNRKYKANPHLKEKLDALIAYLGYWSDKDLITDSGVFIIFGFDS